MYVYSVYDRCVVTNPPYGERLGGAATANQGVGQLMRQLGDRGWGLFALSGDEDFEDHVGRTRCVCGARARETVVDNNGTLCVLLAALTCRS